MQFTEPFFSWIIGGNSLISAVAVFLVVRQYPRAIREALLYFAAGKLSLAITFALLAMRGQLPDILTVAVANTLAILGVSCNVTAARALQGKSKLAWLQGLMVAAALAGSLFFTLVDPDLRGIRLVSSVTAMILIGVLAVELLFRYRLPGRARQITGILAALVAVALLVRLLSVFLLRRMPLVPLPSDSIQQIFFIGAYFGTTIGTVCMVLMSNDAFNLELTELAGTDQLTQLANRRRLLQRGDEELRRAVRFRRPLAAMLIDVDHFKKVNDTMGHAAGDLTLRAVATACTATVRDLDVIGRLGGEEFVVMMPDTDLAAATDVAERLRRSIADLTIPVANGPSIQVTVSVGVAELNEGDANFEALLHRADGAMYVAKHEGRNQVRTAAPVAATVAAPS